MALIQNLPQGAIAHYKKMLGLQETAIRVARHYWARINPDYISQTWDEAGKGLTSYLFVLQREAAIAGAGYTATTLAEQGEYVLPVGFVNVDAFSGWAPEGNLLSQAIASPIPRVLEAIKNGKDTRQALSEGGAYLDRLARQVVVDTARSAASIDIVARPSVGYVRMLNPPSCARCVILAGRRYAFNDGFLRHPGCDCVHVPATVKQLDGAISEGLVVDPYEYFNSLGHEAQNRLLGRYSAQAVREGADIFQVINARRGVQKGGMYTSEGRTRRGHGSRFLSRGQRRMTPEGIYRQAKQWDLSREQVLSLLVEHGYIHEGGQNPLGSLHGQRFGYGQLGHGGKTAGARKAVEEALRTGVRDPNNIYTMTAAERRLFEAERNWKEAQAGLNPYTVRAVERRQRLAGRNIRYTTPDYQLTASDMVRAEAEYRAALETLGHKITVDGRTLYGEQARHYRLLRAKGTTTAVLSGRKKSQARHGGKGTASKRKGKNPHPLTGGAGGGKKPPTGAPLLNGELPFDPHDEWLIEKICYGIPGTTVGGHLYGQTPKGKKSGNGEFPKEWTRETVEAALVDTLKHGVASVGDRGAVEIVHSYKGVELRLSYNMMAPDPAKTVKFYPERGHGVSEVTWKRGKVHRKPVR